MESSFLILNTNTNMEGTDKQVRADDDWKLEGEGQSSDPNLNVCESCQ